MNDSIFPNPGRPAAYSGYPELREQEAKMYVPPSPGLTRRELFAAMAMQGMLSNRVWAPGADDYSAAIRRASWSAIQIADELLNALSSTPKDEKVEVFGTGDKPCAHEYRQSETSFDQSLICSKCGAKAWTITQC